MRVSWSLRTRLAALAALTTLIVLSGVAVIAIWQLRSVTNHALADAARTRLAAVRDSVSPTGQIDPKARARRTATYVQVLDANGRVVSASAALTDTPALLPFPTARQGFSTPRLVNLGAPDLDLAVIATPLRVNGRTGAVIVGVDSQGFLDARDQLRTLVLLGIPVIVLLTGALSWALTGRALRVVTRLTEDADALSHHDATRGLPVNTRDKELRRLVAALNRMLKRLNDRYATNLAAAAETTHRLRTPLATLRAEAELALTEDDPVAARRALEQIIADADRLAAVVDRLLATAGGHGDTEPAVSTLDAAVADWKRQADARGRVVTAAIGAIGLDVYVDATALRACADPVIENALDHTPDTTTVRISTRVDDAMLRVVVCNTGLGIAPAARDSLFQPWSGRPGGGLGLWLARESARAAGGDVRCENFGPPTTTFVITLPTSAQRAAHSSRVRERA